MHNLRYTFGFIMLLLTIFVWLWWHQSYTKDAAALRDQVEAEMNQLVSDEFVFPTLHAVMKQELEALGTHYRFQQQLGTGTRSIHVERGRVDLEGAPRLDITILQGTDEPITSHFYYDQRRYSLNELPPAIQDSMYRRFGVQLNPVPDKPNPQKPTRSQLAQSMQVRVKHISGQNLERPGSLFQINSYRKTLLLGLLPELLFGLFLFSATGYAFISAYRNIAEQKQQLLAKDVLVANVAHELKTPIATVSVALEALNLFGADADPARREEYLAIGQSELQRLDVMADRAIESMQAGTLASKLRRANINLRSSIEDAWRGLALRYELPVEALNLSTYGDTTAAVDAHYWHHLVYNLLDNACKYGGRPLLIDVNLASHAGETVLTVTDNGPGVPDVEREKIFDRFYRIHDPETGHAAKGHGLGLSFVRQIARAHGGSVEVDNTRSGGARFTVRIPR